MSQGCEAPNTLQLYMCSSGSVGGKGWGGMGDWHLTGNDAAQHSISMWDAGEMEMGTSNAGSHNR